MRKLYKTRVKIVNAIQWTGKNNGEVIGFCNSRAYIIDNELILTNGSKATKAILGDYIVRYPDGEYIIKSEQRFNLEFEGI